MLLPSTRRKSAPNYIYGTVIPRAGPWKRKLRVGKSCTEAEGRAKKTFPLRAGKGNDGNFASNLFLGHRDAPPLFSFLEDGSRLARNPVYLSRPINIGSSLGGKFWSSLPLRATVLRLCSVTWPWKSRRTIVKIKLRCARYRSWSRSFLSTICLACAGGIVCIPDGHTARFQPDNPIIFMKVIGSISISEFFILFHVHITNANLLSVIFLLLDCAK